MAPAMNAEKSWDALGQYIAPILCKRPSEQAFFRAQWTLYFADLDEADAPDETRQSTDAETGNVDTRPEDIWRMALRVASVLTVLALVAFALWLVRAQPDDTEPDIPLVVVPPEQEEVEPVPLPGQAVAERSTEELFEVPDPEAPAFEIIAPPPTRSFDVRRLIWSLVPMILLAAALIWRHRRRAMLERQFDAGDGDVRRIGLSTGGESLFAAGSFLRKTRDLNRHTRARSNRLDVSKTIRAAQKSAGFPEPVYATVPQIPEYLFFIERVSRNDHLTAYGRLIAKALRTENVNLHIFEFHADLRICTVISPEGFARQGVKSIEEIAATHPTARAIVLASKDSYFDPLNMRLASWLGALKPFEGPKMLTLVPYEQWSQAETRMRAAGLDVVPATMDGMSQLFTCFFEREGQDWAYAPGEAQWEAPFPDAAIRSLEDLPNDVSDAPDTVEDILVELEDYLGTAGYQWLQACAIFPLVVPDITLQLGANLKTETQDEAGAPRPLMDERSFGRLAQLPWFRTGFMPEVLRKLLMADMPSDFEKQVRDTLNSVLLSAWDAQGDDSGMDIVVRKGVRWREVLMSVIRRSDRQSPLREYLFLSFMNGSVSARMAVNAPDKVTRLLRRGWDIPAIGAGAAAVTCAAAIWLFQPTLYVNHLWLRATDPAAMSELELTALLARHEEWLKSDGASGAQADFSNRDMTRLARLGTNALNGARLESAIGSNSSFFGTILSAVDLNASQLDAVNFSLAILSGIDLSSGTLRGANLSTATIDNVRFASSDLSSSFLDNTVVTNADFSDAALPFATFARSRLENVDFSNAVLDDVDFSSSILNNVVFENASLAGARFTGVNLTGTLGLTRQQLLEACGDAATVPPQGLSIALCEGGGLVDNLPGDFFDPEQLTQADDIPNGTVEGISPPGGLQLTDLPEGEAFQDCANCPQMVPVRGGTFVMGAGTSDADATPKREVVVPGFAIGAFEITVAEWNACAELGGCQSRRDGAGDEPVVQVSWQDAQDFAGWMSANTGVAYRLPTEAEWEYAAFRGAENVTRENLRDYAHIDASGRTNVGSLTSYANGLFDMQGNVWEWTLDCWAPDYQSAPDDGSAWVHEQTDCTRAPIRGGSYLSDASASGISARNWADRTDRSITLGFRLVRE